MSALVRREIFTVLEDPLSPERGQYSFLGDLIRWVAYETLSKKERKVRHLAVAAYLEEAFEEEDDRRGRRVALPPGVRCRAGRG